MLCIFSLPIESLQVKIFGSSFLHYKPEKASEPFVLISYVKNELTEFPLYRNI